MTKGNLKVVNSRHELDKDKLKALEAAIGQIDENFWKRFCYETWTKRSGFRY
jgi:hypothetical protein